MSVLLSRHLFNSKGPWDPMELLKPVAHAEAHRVEYFDLEKEFILMDFLS